MLHVFSAKDHEVLSPMLVAAYCPTSVPPRLLSYCPKLDFWLQYLTKMAVCEKLNSWLQNVSSLMVDNTDVTLRGFLRGTMLPHTHL